MDVNERESSPWYFVFWDDKRGLRLVLGDVRRRYRRLAVSERSALLGVTGDWNCTEGDEKKNL